MNGMRSYRAWSAMQGVWYLLLVASLVYRPPGKYTSAVYQGHRITIPQHPTFFQQFAGGTSLWVAAFAVLAVGLIVAAAVLPRALVFAHGGLLAITYTYGIGNIVAGLQLHVGFTAGALACACAAGHALIIRHRPLST